MSGTSKFPTDDPRLLRFLEAWRASRGDGVIPRRADFDPLRVPDLLRWVWMYSWDRQVGDFVCDLAGEQVSAAWKGQLRGKTLHGILGDPDHAEVRERWSALLATPAILVGTTGERLSNQSLHRANRMIAPLIGRSGAIDTVIGVSLYRVQAARPDEPLLSRDEIRIIPCDTL